MPEQKYLDLLDQLSTQNNPHSGRSLRNHLIGTYQLLKQWNNPIETCLAGLFHSIYGTQFYKIQTVELTQRERMKQIIGEPAENLAYLFCIADRQEFFQILSTKPLELSDRIAEKKIKITEETLKALIEIEVANCLEQIEHIEQLSKESLTSFCEKMEKGKNYMSKEAYQAFKQFASQKK